MTGIDVPTLSLIIFSAAIDSINPCAFGVLILMITVVLGQKGSVGKLLKLGFFYIFAIFVTYLAAGLGLIYFLANVPLYFTEYLALVVGTFVILAGLLELKDYFWYGEGFSLQIPHVFMDKIHSLSKNVSVIGVTILGAFIAAVELPCTGAPYLAIITILSLNFNLQAFMLLILYNLIFISPLVVILLSVVAGVKVSSVKNWKQANKSYMRFGIGFLLIGLGWLLILIANGTVNFG